MSKRKQVQGNMVAQTVKNKCLDGSYLDHRKYMNNYRSKVMRLVRQMKMGKLPSRLDIDRLQNFCQFSLALMDRSSMTDIDKAWLNAETMSFIHADMQIEILDQSSASPEDYRVVLDPEEQANADPESTTS
jgi:hypothetical protein